MKKGNKKYFSDINKNILKFNNSEFVDEEQYENFEINGLNLFGRSFSSFDFRDCLIKNCNFNQVKIKKLSLLNVRFENCDLANLEVEELYIKRSDLLGCRMMGFSSPEAILREVWFDACQLKLSQFRFTKLKDINFFDCSLGEADFYSSEMNNVNFSKCDLMKTEMSKTRHFNTDLRTSIISGMSINIESLKGVTIDYSQVNDLIWLLGVNIK